MFVNRFGTKWSKEGPERLKNIYFTYMLELRALVKAAPYIKSGQLFYMGNEKVCEHWEIQWIILGTHNHK
jgi:hypothetical protein